MKSKTTTDEDQLIHFEQINLQEVEELTETPPKSRNTNENA